MSAGNSSKQVSLARSERAGNYKSRNPTSLNRNSSKRQQNKGKNSNSSETAPENSHQASAPKPAKGSKQSGTPWPSAYAGAGSANGSSSRPNQNHRRHNVSRSSQTSASRRNLSTFPKNKKAVESQQQQRAIAPVVEDISAVEPSTYLREAAVASMKSRLAAVVTLSQLLSDESFGKAQDKQELHTFTQSQNKSKGDSAKLSEEIDDIFSLALKVRETLLK